MLKIKKKAVHLRLRGFLVGSWKPRYWVWTPRIRRLLVFLLEWQNVKVYTNNKHMELVIWHESLMLQLVFDIQRLFRWNLICSHFWRPIHCFAVDHQLVQLHELTTPSNSIQWKTQKFKGKHSNVKSNHLANVITNSIRKGRSPHYL